MTWHSLPGQISRRARPYFIGVRGSVGTGRRSAVLLGILLAAFAAFAQSPVPAKPQGYVNDFAGVLSSATRANLTALCTEVDQKTQAQIAIVTITSLNGRPIQDYSFELATKWGVGHKKSNRGILILLAIEDHQYWTQVGYGLEAILPDGKVGGFGRQAVPLLRQKNYDAAIRFLAGSVANVIAQERGITLASEPTPARPVAAPSPTHPGPARTGLKGWFQSLYDNGTVGLIVLLLYLYVLYLLIRLALWLFGWFIAFIVACISGRPLIRPEMSGSFGIGGVSSTGSAAGGIGGGGGGGGSFGGFGGGSFGGGGAGGSW